MPQPLSVIMSLKRVLPGGADVVSSLGAAVKN